MSESSYFDYLPDLAAGQLRLADLRSPCEFMEGSMPFAINVPLFTDDERAEVGTLYKQAGAREATQRGLEMVAQKIERLIDDLSGLANPGGQIALHCWRGGQRSGAVATLLRAIGMRPILLTGGYKKYRHQVLSRLERLASHDLLILNGRTGCGKSKMLRDIQNDGVACIDFENLAVHRGSALGDLNLPSPQPTQQNFENLLANEYESVRNSKLILAEIEQDLGTIRMPQNLRRKIYESPMILLTRDFGERVEHLREEYTRTWSDAEHRKFLEKMGLLKPHLQGPVYDLILEKAREKSFNEIIALLLEHRYDRCYDKGLRKQERNIIATVNVSDGWHQAKQAILDVMSTRKSG